MLLHDLQTDGHVRDLAPAQLLQLAEELREQILAAVSAVGGHLGSNLGVVELTIALHRVLDLPHDRLVWDTGHQAYAHKMLTGRLDGFASLRQADGLSGYPSRAESDHDVVENSHASTAVSWVAGMARAQHDVAVEQRRRLVAVVGDGALTGGMAYEALNNLGHHQLPAVIVLNDNGRSYAETVSRLSGRVDDLRTDPRYRVWRDHADRLLDRLPLAGRLAGAGLEGVKTALAEAPALRAFVESLGVHYLGPEDGHDLDRLEVALRHALRIDGPVLLHVLTRKGQGYAPAETDPEKKLHDTSAFDLVTGRPARATARSWTQVFSEVLLELADTHPELIAITAAMPGSTGLLPLAERDPARVLDVGIAEQHAVTAAAGLAYGGRLPLVAVYSTFLSRAFDQANLDVGLHGEHVVFVLDRAGITGDDGPSHHGILDLALALRIPGATVLAPSCEEDLAALLRTALERDGPVFLRFPKGTAVTAAELGIAADDPVDGLAARRLRDGSDVCVLAVGDRAAPSLQAADQLAEHGIEAAVWDVRSVRPADPAMLAAAARSPLVVTVENGLVSGGAGAELADRLQELAGIRQAPPVLKLGVPTTYLAQGRPDHILAQLGLDGAGIAAEVRKVAADRT